MKYVKIQLHYIYSILLKYKIQYRLHDIIEKMYLIKHNEETI